MDIALAGHIKEECENLKEGLFYALQKLHEWLAGVIDGDGSFQLSKKGYASLEICT